MVEDIYGRQQQGQYSQCDYGGSYQVDMGPRIIYDGIGGIVLLRFVLRAEESVDESAPQFGVDKPQTMLNGFVQPCVFSAGSECNKIFS